jgi:hypothetical protein
MLKTTDKKRAKYLLEVRKQGGHKFFHFVRTNKVRYLGLVGYLGVFSGYLATIDQWFFFWVFLAFFSGALLADISWLRGMKKSWPFMEKALNWNEVERIAGEDRKA